MAAALNLLPGCKSLHYGRNDQRSCNFHGFTFQRLGTQADARLNLSHGIEPRNRATETATDIHKWSAVKSPLGAQTVLGDRHDLVYEILLQVPSAACGTRPRELSNGWARKQMCN